MKHFTLPFFMSLLSASIIAQSAIAQGDSIQATKAGDDLLDFSLISTGNNDTFGDFDFSIFEEKAGLPFDISDLENSLPDPDLLSRDEKVANSEKVSFDLDELEVTLPKATELSEATELPKAVEVMKMAEQPEQIELPVKAELAEVTDLPEPIKLPEQRPQLAVPELEIPKVLPRSEDVPSEDVALESIELAKDVPVERAEKPEPQRDALLELADKAEPLEDALLSLDQKNTTVDVGKPASQVVVQQPVEDISDNFDGVISGTSLPETKIELFDPIHKGVVAVCQSDKEGKFGFTNVKTEKGKGKPYRLHFPEKQMKAPSFTLSESSPYHNQKNIFSGVVPENKPRVCIEDKK